MKNLKFSTEKHVDSGRILNSGDGGGTFDGMEAKVAALEAHLSHMQNDVKDIKTDIREIRTLVIYGLSGSFILLASMIITEYLRLSATIAAIQ